MISGCHSSASPPRPIFRSISGVAKLPINVRNSKPRGQLEHMAPVKIFWDYFHTLLLPCSISPTTIRKDFCHFTALMHMGFFYRTQSKWDISSLEIASEESSCQVGSVIMVCHDVSNTMKSFTYFFFLGHIRAILWIILHWFET